MDFKIGFSTGTIHKSKTAREAIGEIKALGCKAIELGFVRMSRIEEGQLEEILASDLVGFEHVSFHAPKFEYGDNERTFEIFEKIKRIDKLRKLDVVVFHPDPISDFGVFQLLDFNVGFENMDNQKASFQKPEELFKIINQNSRFSLVLDVNHIFSNDQTMSLVDGFYSKLEDRISEIHISGYAGYHEPIFRTQQREIIKAVRVNRPLIIESVLDLEDMKQEMDYIQLNLEGLKIS